MYGKQFIAGLMFLAVANVRAQDDEEVDAEEGAELYEASPEPDLEAAPEDAGVEVEIPEGDWTISKLGFGLLAIDEEWTSADEWAEGLPDELAAYTPTDYFLSGVAVGEALEENGYALGAQGESQSQGILAVSWAGEQFTVYFDAETDYEEEGALAATIDPELANVEEGFEDNSGVGDVWGQSYDGQFWHIWSYNGEDGSESWEEGALSVLYVEYDVETEEFSSFTTEIDLVTDGAASLIATATTASLLLAMM